MYDLIINQHKNNGNFYFTDFDEGVSFWDNNLIRWRSVKENNTIIFK